MLRLVRFEDTLLVKALQCAQFSPGLDRTVDCTSVAIDPLKWSGCGWGMGFSVRKSPDLKR